jgi:hypothetical protein
MEEDIYTHRSEIKVPKSAVKVEERLKEAIEAAEDRQAYESAHDEQLLHALGIVANFIKRKRRVCYGGTAMNAILPKSKQFYDPQHDLPDYDFYTPQLKEDVQDLVDDLKAAGFKDVYHRIGIHEGTEKILVNFVAVADITHIESDIFSILYRRSVKKDGIHYTDPDILRMMMYLELSRPRGQVDRWEKVYERLQLINRQFPIRAAGAGGVKASVRSIPYRVRKFLIEYCIAHQRIVCTGPIASLYAKGIRQGNMKYQVREGGPVLFVSPDPKLDALALKRGLEREESADLRLYLHKERGEIVPERVEIRLNGQPICMIVKDTACHSYNNFPMKDGRILLVGSLEFLVTLYLSLQIFTKAAEDILGSNAMSQVREFIRLADENAAAKRSQFPPFALGCKGHQTGYMTLMRRKVERIQKAKGALAGATKKVRRGATAAMSLRGATKKRERGRD